MQSDENGEPQFQNEPPTGQNDQSVPNPSITPEATSQPDDQTPSIIEQSENFTPDAASNIDTASQNENEVSVTTGQPSAPEPVQQTPILPAFMTPIPQVYDTQPVSPPKKSAKKLLIALAIALPVFFASAAAAAYVGVVIPNQPENVLKAAVANAFLEDNLNAKGTLDLEPADPKKQASITATSINFDIKNNATNNFMSAKFDMAMSGVKFNADTRYVDETAYLKLGDLSTVSMLADSYMPGASTMLKSVENQWIEFDKTLLKQAGAACYIENSLRVTESDLKQLAAAYDTAPFFTIKKVTSEAVNGQDAKKFELEMDDDKMADFMKTHVAKIPSAKKMLDCAKNQTDDALESLKDGDVTPMTLWIGDDKKIIKFVSVSTKQDADKENLKGSIEAYFSYDEVKVSKPASSKPAMQLFGELQSQLQ